MPANSTNSSRLIRALHKLDQTSAIGVSDDTTIPVPTTRFVMNHCLATHIARSKESFAFVPDLGPYQTSAILRSANEAWKHEKLPSLAVCAFSKSPVPFQKETGIQADTADQFLSDLKFAHRMVPTLGASPAYIIRHNHAPNDKYDDVILPAHANLIVYEPHALSPDQLATLFEHVANVRGKIILCGDQSELANFHPELTDAVENSISKAVPAKLRHLCEPSSSHDEKPSAEPRNPIASANGSRPIRDFEPKNEDAVHHENPSPSRKSYLVYHAKTDGAADFPNGYVLVAKVQTDDIFRALSNSHYSASTWTENPGVVAFTHNARSTRPGDIICEHGEVKRLSVEDIAKINLMDSPRDRLQKEKFSSDNPAPETPEPDRPRRKFKP